MNLFRKEMFSGIAGNPALMNALQQSLVYQERLLTNEKVPTLPEFPRGFSDIQFQKSRAY